ncbi:MAG TPA: hypothetical protein VGC07_10770 [Granulicella sp.]
MSNSEVLFRPGSFSLTQKRLFSGFPLAVLSRHACDLCGKPVFPERDENGDWVPAPHECRQQQSFDA